MNITIHGCQAAKKTLNCAGIRLGTVSACRDTLMSKCPLII
ncbi:hypothetical protein [Paenibacillus graminis]|nr:hypothetical protein [Paenibacillus graminis]